MKGFICIIRKYVIRCLFKKKSLMDRLEWVKISSREASEEMFTEAQVMTNKGLKKEVSESAKVSYNQKMMVKSIQNKCRNL